MLEAVAAFAAGLLIGSFLNVCVYRLPNDLSVVSPARSYCPRCKNTIAWYDNVPVLSFILLGGRCRHCREPIPLRYPAVELLTGALFFVIVLADGLSAVSLKLCVFAALLVGLVFTDIEERILPDEFTLGGVAAGILFAPVVPIEISMLAPFLPFGWNPGLVSVLEAATGAAVSAGILWLVRAVYFAVRKKEGMGLGDLKMIAMIGAFLGLFGAIQTVIAGSVLGSVIGLAYIYLARKDASSYELPFGVFLGAAAMAVALLQAGVFTLSWSPYG